MNISKTIRVALGALGQNKMRSFLTALGIIIFHGKNRGSPETNRGIAQS